MILSDSKIKESISSGDIVITPYDEKNLGSNSYDVHLGKHFAVYADDEIDAKKHNLVRHFEIPDSGFVMQPGELYLASTIEYTETHRHCPFLEGKSSTGRLGIDIHATAGKGDVGFCGYWTLEMSCAKPVRIYPRMPVGQLIYYVVDGDVENPYHSKKGAKYSHQDHLPKESMMWKNNF